MEDARAVLAAAATLIGVGYCRGSDAVDGAGHPVLPHAERACAWSATGAIFLAGRGATGRVWIDAMRALARAVGVEHMRELKWENAPMLVRELCDHVWKWEDEPERTQGHVLEAFETAKEYVR